ncbi:small lysine-rich protein 1-like [Ostrinia furnacalis]|uniref:small lysine-rich protein 1-like n=1 Tax=Ostrinia furnacalis TaxID=93504 RepID=UPI00103CFA40|nr:small lysine-rich protein 1-like [Ostrinia furnacalis]
MADDNDGAKKGKKKSKEMDILSPAAMDNAYYGCHNVQELLEARGYQAPGFDKKKKKGK